MRIARITGESLAYNPEYTDSEELRDDRMMNDPILVMNSSGGGVNFELSYPEDESPLSEFMMSAFMSTWANTPQRFNDGVADSVVTDVAATGVITVTTGAAFAAGHLIRNSGFSTPANNGTFRVTAGSATVPSVGAGLLSAEAVPPGTARVKVVGFEGVAGDITTTATGLASTALDFTTLGLTVGKAIKVGGALASQKFTTSANNAWARIIAITATSLTLDNLPSGWAIDAGAGKTIRVWFGDTIKNGVTANSLSIERGFMGQIVPSYIINTGMQADTMQMTIASKDKIKGSVDFKGMGGGSGTVTVDASPDPETTTPVFASNPNFQRLSEGGSTVSGPNWVQAVDFTINNNQRMIEDIGSVSPVEITPGECLVTGKSDFIFGDQTILQKFYNGTPTSIFMSMAKASRGMVFQFPRVTYRGGTNPSATGKNTDIRMALDWQASKDTLTQSHCIMERFEYVE
jgi:hypothetical protein